MSIINKKVIRYTLLAFTCLLAMACSKDKIDARVGHQPDNRNMAKSGVRLIQLSGSTDLIVNNIKLTDWHLTPAGGAPVPYPTPYFPNTGKLSGAWFLPQQFLDASGQAYVKIGQPQNATADFIADSFRVQDDYNHPWDYYLGTSAKDVKGIYSVTPVPRTTVAPADPSHFRIRLVNLSSALGEGATNKLSLAFADGARVSATTSGIGNHAWSDYIELPYGTYQFKVLIDGSNRQIPGKTPILTSLDSDTLYGLNSSQVYYAPVRAYQPGGVYTIAVALTSGSYQNKEYQLYPNAATGVTDIEPPVNITFGRIQIVNAVSEKGIQTVIDNLPAQAADYGKAGDYVTLVKGAHHVKVTDAAGKILAEKEIQVNAGDNLSIWAYPNKSAVTDLLVVQNNMSGVRNMWSGNDGSDAANGLYDPLNFGMLVQTRFLNLCPDLPYVTFTRSNGALFTEDRFSSALAAQNLQPGKAADALAVPYPYIDLRIVTGNIIQAYSSRPGVLPGNRLVSVPVLTPADFIRMPAFFFPNGKSGAEPGVYTVALIGRSNNDQQPAMVVIKHNQ
ncbi:hypothetical protein ACDQ55_14800 [Chitinophaga sp. 30R24]|uniref:hypothetical protein n=1 Tax=Chitinophaga sp. 30R24 TaxID=3248838 RepID=UPI003B8FB8DD